MSKSEPWSNKRLKYLRESIADMTDADLQTELALSEEDLDPDSPENVRLARGALQKALSALIVQPCPKCGREMLGMSQSKIDKHLKDCRGVK